MSFRYEKHITRQMLRDNPNTLFVFGDNMKRKGMGGQAAEMRGEPNAVGIPTKMEPSMHEEAFFTNNDLALVEPEIRKAAARLGDHLENGGNIVWPADGIGSGRAQLEHRAPNIWLLIESIREGLIIRAFSNP